MLPNSLFLPANSTTNPPAQFIYEYGSMYLSNLQSAFNPLSEKLPVLNLSVTKELHSCSGFTTTIQNANDRVFFEEWLSSIIDSRKVSQVPQEFCRVLSPHLVVESGGKKRVVGNFRGLNRHTVKESFNGPSISTIVPECSKYMFHTKVDLKLGFNNMGVHPAAAFVLISGIFLFLQCDAIRHQFRTLYVRPLGQSLLSNCSMFHHFKGLVLSR